MEIKRLLQKNEEDKGDKKKPNKIIIGLIIAAIMILVVPGFFESDTKKKADTTACDFDGSEYAKQQEKRLEMILEKINGAGKVAVYITIDGGGEKIPARDEKSKIAKEGEDVKNKYESEKDTSSNNYNKYNEENESLVVSGGKSSTEPYIVEQKTPEISGVLVVATGAASEKVRLEIYEAVKAVYGIAAHRIKVAF